MIYTGAKNDIAEEILPLLHAQFLKSSKISPSGSNKAQTTYLSASTVYRWSVRYPFYQSDFCSLMSCAERGYYNPSPSFGTENPTHPTLTTENPTLGQAKGLCCNYIRRFRWYVYMWVIGVGSRGGKGVGSRPPRLLSVKL